MLRFAVAASIALCTTGALAGTFPSQPLYPSFSSAKAQIIKIEPPGAVSSFAVAINAKGVVAGYYQDQYARGFIRKANGTFLKFGAGKGNTTVSGMNAGGDVIGIYEDRANVKHGFVRKAGGTITKFDPPNSTDTEPSGINNHGEIAGTFIDTNGYHGFLRTSSGKITIVDRHDSTCDGTNLLGINLAGSTIGGDCTGFFVRDSQGNFTLVRIPGTNQVVPNSINANGTVAGYFYDNMQVSHGFVRSPSGSITIVDAPPGRKYEDTIMGGLNGAGVTVGYHRSGHVHRYQGFIRSNDGVYTTVSVPGAYYTEAISINDMGQVVGTYFTNAEEPHAFLRTP